jgi:hypothetical protein
MVGLWQPDGSASVGLIFSEMTHLDIRRRLLHHDGGGRMPALNNHGGFGRWDFIEIADPRDAEDTIRTSLQKGTKP